MVDSNLYQTEVAPLVIYYHVPLGLLVYLDISLRSSFTLCLSFAPSVTRRIECIYF